METTVIEGMKYRVRFNDDPECPVSMWRIYEPGERRTVIHGSHRITQVKQEDGSWWNIRVEDLWR